MMLRIGCEVEKDAGRGSSAERNVQLHIGGKAGTGKPSAACNSGDGDAALRNMGPQFETMYAKVGRPSIAPEKLLRALLLQVLYTVRSERMLMEQLNYTLLFRWFVGMNIDDPVWDVTVFTKNRERLLGAEVDKIFFAQVLAQAHYRELLSTEHFTVDGTLIEAWASHKSFKRKDGSDQPPPDDPGIPRSTSMASGAATPPTSRPPTPTRDWRARGWARKPSSATPGTVRHEGAERRP